VEKPFLTLAAVAEPIAFAGHGPAPPAAFANSDHSKYRTNPPKIPILVNKTQFALYARIISNNTPY
jgi:hypothetical protein